MASVPQNTSKIRKNITRGRRAPLACETCRARKVKCSGKWPACDTCVQRGNTCVYNDAHPQSVRESPQHEVVSSLPSDKIIEGAFLSFFKHYGDSIFCFVRQTTLLDDFRNGKVPACFQLSILTVVARFVEPCYKLYGGTVEASEHFAKLARASLQPMYDDITLLNMQCHLLLCIHSIGHGNEHQAWLRLGIAIRVAQALRLWSEDAYLEENTIDAETKRRTFWCCFVLDRLLANGNDRPMTFVASSITTRLPATSQDFLLGRTTMTGTLESANSASDSLFAATIRLMNILGRFIDWSGAGGRHSDHRCPWVADMPIASFQNDLDRWEESLPSHMKLNDHNFSAHTAASEGLGFAFMHLMYFNALCHLHREYLPLAPPATHDPGNGPCDGPKLLPSPENPGWWVKSIRKGVSSAKNISDIYSAMIQQHGISGWVQPLLGYCLVTSSTFHIFCFIHEWQSCKEYLGEPAKKHLISDLGHLIVLQESWPVAANWVRSPPRVIVMHADCFYRSKYSADSSKKSVW
ncbi:fungal-specific transcription factor domain-containing protein [Halenospora varia]|nr:fungal-specific transcription factor domain-containing protein [Halenospora varia]